MSTFDLLSGLGLEIESYDLAGLERDVSSDFTRRTTIVSLHGAGETGVGEDVTYSADDHERFQQAGAVHALHGAHTVDSFSGLVGSIDLFPAAEPGNEWQARERDADPEDAGERRHRRQSG